MFGFLAFFVGSLTALQSRANGRLAVHLNNGILAGLVSNLTGFALLFIILAFSPKDRSSFFRILRASRHREIKLWEVLGGFGGAFFLAASLGRSQLSRKPIKLPSRTASSSLVLLAGCQGSGPYAHLARMTENVITLAQICQYPWP